MSPIFFLTWKLYSNPMKQIEISCPRCGAETHWYDNPSRPFCSEKCRMIDLGRWSNEEYSISGVKQTQYEEELNEF